MRGAIRAAAALVALAAPAPALAVTPQHVRVKSFDGVELDGWLRVPALKPGEKAPVVLWSSPYFGQLYDQGDSSSYDTSDTYVPTMTLVKRGYAVAMFNVRGTGNSQGCFDFVGPDEQRDQVALVHWLARQRWSSGRVGMMGDSYDGTTPLEAAVRHPSALKTIVAEGPVSNFATGLEFTPNGAEWADVMPQWPAYGAAISLLPPLLGDNAPANDAASHPSLDSRLCPDAGEILTGGSRGPGADMRDARFYRERDFLDRFPSIRASVLWVQGYYDDEYFSDDTIWPALSHAPKRYITGPFPHVAPDGVVPDWSRQLFAWLDYWLKGVGPRPEHLGQVTWEEARDPGVPPAVFPTGPWHQSASWPPAESHSEVLYLTGDALATQPGGTSRTYQSLPTPEGMNGPMLGPGGYYWPKAFACPGDTGPVTNRLLMATAPLAKPVTVAGNPFAYVRLATDQPGGIVTVNLLDLAGDPCVTGGQQSATQIAHGAADLRFDHGNWTASAPPVGEPFGVRIDLTAIGHAVPAGHRIAVLVSYGPPLDHASAYLPAVTVEAAGARASQLVLPLSAGTLGGAPPSMAYPPRPFAGAAR